MLSIPGTAGNRFILKSLVGQIINQKSYMYDTLTQITYEMNREFYMILTLIYQEIRTNIFNKIFLKETI